MSCSLDRLMGYHSQIVLVLVIVIVIVIVVVLVIVIANSEKYNTPGEDQVGIVAEGGGVNE
jgi:uncharacterized membrane protein YqiK